MSLAFSNFYKNSIQKPQGLDKSYPGDALLDAVLANWDKASRGYREGVILVPIEVRSICSSVVPIKPDMEFLTSYVSRVPGETPRKKTVALVDKLPLAGSVFVVVYRADVLEEDNDRSSNADWEIVTVLANPGEEDIPMNPGTLMANHFHIDGGTSTKMSPEEFEVALGKSFLFWKSHTLAVERT